MLQAIGILFVGLLLAAYETPKLFKKRWWRELCVFTVLISVAVAVGIANSLHVQLPNPMDWIQVIYRPARDMLDAIFK
ncbi:MULTISPECIES: hypothetical protein [unclassified Paenibacillus]|uniref:hypothetical protein n=1 Tax=unclassified Paenibacillus TaxID=185978 RepID=UPI003644E6E4